MSQGRTRGKILAFIAVLVVFTLGTAKSFTGTQSVPGQNLGNLPYERKEEIGKLLAVLRDVDLRKTHPDQVIAAIRRLGELRASEAIDDLIELLTFSPLFPGEVPGPDGRPIVEFQLNRYPATGALFQIGRPALPALVRVIEFNKLDSLKGQKALDTIQSIFRDDLIEGAMYLERAAESSAASASLKQAATQLRQLNSRLANSSTNK